MARLLKNPAEISKGHFHFVIDASTCPEALPGQFINIKTGTGTDPLIRRPFSVYDFRNGTMEIVVKMVGRGTRTLSGLPAGTDLDLLGPMGKGFTLRENSKVLLIGGGVGNAPLHFLARALGNKKNHITYLYGIRNRDYLYLRESYRAACDRLIIATDDGSEGEKGFVTDITRTLLAKESFDYIYTCGPSVMMRGLMDIVRDSGTGVEVSLENYFGCGVGLCSGCTVATSLGNRRACVDGPVMDGRIINWDSVAD